MGLTICDMSVSLDGYVTGPNDSRENPFGDGAQDLHAWLRPAASDDDRSILQSTIDSVGAIVMGRTSFEKNEGDGGWGDGGPLGDTPLLRGHPSRTARRARPGLQVRDRRRGQRARAGRAGGGEEGRQPL